MHINHSDCKKYIGHLLRALLAVWRQAYFLDTLSRVIFGLKPRCARRVVSTPTLHNFVEGPGRSFSAASISGSNHSATRSIAALHCG